MATWIEFCYRDFYDVPRMIVTRSGGRNYLLDCPFDEVSSEYADSYSVFLLPEVSPETLAGSWEALKTLATSPVGTVKVDAVRFDPTRRHQMDADSIPPFAGPPRY